MSKMSQLFLDEAPDRVSEVESDLRYLRTTMVNASVELGRLASRIESLAPAGWRGIVSEMRFLQGELLEASRDADDN